LQTSAKYEMSLSSSIPLLITDAFKIQEKSQSTSLGATLSITGRTAYSTGMDGFARAKGKEIRVVMEMKASQKR